MTTDLGNPHDRFLKEIWSRKRVSRDFLWHYLPAAVVALLDLNTLELTKDSFIDQRLREYYSDLGYPLKPGRLLQAERKVPARTPALPGSDCSALKG